ncbi:MAG: cupin domain-containing protein [Caldilineaceae bacterium]
MKLIPRYFMQYFMLLFAIVLTACVPIQAPVAAPAAAAPASGDAAATGPVAELSGEFEVVQLIVDFAAGAWTPSHTHGGMLVVTVRNGELTVRDDGGQETVYKPGESFVEIPGVYLEIGNAGTDVASVATIALLPAGEKLTTTKEGISTDNAPPGPTVTYQHKQPVTEALGEFELQHLVSDFAPGAWTPSHTHGGMLVVMVMNGELTVRDDQGAETIYKAGEAFVETPGTYLEIGNDGTDIASVSTAALLSKGAQLTTVKEGISTDKVPPGPELKHKYVLAGNSK